MHLKGIVFDMIRCQNSYKKHLKLFLFRGFIQNKNQIEARREKIPITFYWKRGCKYSHFKNLETSENPEAQMLGHMTNKSKLAICLQWYLSQN